MRTTIIGTACLLAILTCGCASSVNKGRQSLTIDTSPSGATVYENGAEVGRTPFSYTYDKEDGSSVTLELRMEGRESRSFELTPTLSRGVLFADAMLLNIPYYAGDARSNMLYTFPQKEFNVNLYRSIPTDVQQIDLPVVTLLSSTGGSGYGHLGSKHLSASSRELSDLSYPEQLTNEVVSGMKNTFVDARTTRQGTQKGDEAIRRAKIYLKPVLKRVEMKLDEVDDRAFGTVEMDFDWEFHNGVGTNEVLFTIPTHTRYPAFNDHPTEVLESAARDAARQLLDEDGLREKLQGAYNAGLVLSKGSAITLAKPDPVKFNGRKDMLSALVKAVATIETKEGHGSAFLITNDGYLITNAHVVGDASSVKVKFQQGFTLDGQVVKVNRDFDVALVKTPGDDLPALAMGDDAGLQLGEELYAIGTPLDEQLGQTVTRGIMSGRREFEGRTFIQTDVSINPGNSGGPLIDENGKVVGVATLKVSETGVQGIGFGVPISKALEMLNIAFGQ